MVLSNDQVLALFLIVPSLVSGVVSAAVAFLLQRLRRDRVFGSFAWFSLALTSYGFVDGILSWSRPDLGSLVFVGLGFLDLLLIAGLATLLGRLTADLLGQLRPLWERWLLRLPVVGALLVEAAIAVDLASWSVSSLVAIGAAFLVVLFLLVIACGLRLILHWPQVHDRIFRRILVGTGVLLVAFVPLWLIDLFGRAGLFSFYWFLLAWNLGALVLASRAFFEPPVQPPAHELFAEASLMACVQRFGLTPREAEVARLHAQGFPAKDIGGRLFIAPKTVRNHISSVYEKTGVGQRREWLELLRSTPSRR